MLALDRNVKVSCGNCGTSVTKKHLCQHKSSCSSGKLYCPRCPNFSTKSGDDWNYHIAKKHSAAGPKNNHKCKECSIEFNRFYSLRHHKKHYQIAENTSSGEKADMQSLADVGDDKRLEEELQLCRHYLVDFETQKGRHGWYSISGSYSRYRNFHIWHRSFRRRKGWGTCTTKHQKVREQCSVGTI